MHASGVARERETVASGAIPFHVYREKSSALRVKPVAGGAG